MNEARYTLLVPQSDDVGNVLKELTEFVRSDLERAIPNAHVWVEHPRHKGHETFGTVVVVGKETPEVDSHIKQMAHHIGEIANCWGVTVIKEGKQGIKTWEITNSSYRPDEPAEALTHLPK